MVPKNNSLWICSQIGARENYAIPRALNSKGLLEFLITDAWVTPKSILAGLSYVVKRGLSERYHPDLTDSTVYEFTFPLIAHQISQKIKKQSDWNITIAQNVWFQKYALNVLNNYAKRNRPYILFSYSYAALELFRFAKMCNWITVLGQIDPGPEEEKIVRQEYERNPQYRGNWEPAPTAYWQTWREECNLADRIVVNSQWSRQLLIQAGINPDKIHIIPLVYSLPETAQNFIRTYPESFSPSRPMRVLFLGQIVLRKGVAAILDAVEKLHGEPIEFWMVGSPQIEIPSHFKNHPQIRWVGPVPRSQTANYYQQADVFLFPTLSDGFGLTQLEALAWKLPIIKSRYCGEVVNHGGNGWILEEVNSQRIAETIKTILRNPLELKKNSEKITSNTDPHKLSLFSSLISCI